MVSTVCEVLQLRWFLQDLTVEPKGPTPLICDNEVARHIAANHVYQEQTKHIEMDCYFMCEIVHSGEVRIVDVRAELQTAYIFTKSPWGKQLQVSTQQVGCS